MEDTNALQQNSLTIQNELDWLSKLIDNRLDFFFTNEKKKQFVYIPSPNLKDDRSNLSSFIQKDLTDDFERLLIIGVTWARRCRSSQRCSSRA